MFELVAEIERQRENGSGAGQDEQPVDAGLYLSAKGSGEGGSLDEQVGQRGDSNKNATDFNAAQRVNAGGGEAPAWLFFGQFSTPVVGSIAGIVDVNASGHDCAKPRHCEEHDRGACEVANAHCDFLMEVVADA